MISDRWTAGAQPETTCIISTGSVKRVIFLYLFFIFITGHDNDRLGDILNDGCVCVPVCVCSGSSGHGFRGPPAYLCLHDVFYQWQNLDPYQTLLVNSTTCYNSTVLSCNKQPLSWQHCSVILGLKVILCHLGVCVCVCARR